MSSSLPAQTCAISSISSFLSGEVLFEKLLYPDCSHHSQIHFNIIAVRVTAPLQQAPQIVFSAATFRKETIGNLLVEKKNVLASMFTKSTAGDNV